MKNIILGFILLMMFSCQERIPVDACIEKCINEKYSLLNKGIDVISFCNKFYENKICCFNRYSTIYMCGERKKRR